MRRVIIFCMLAILPLACGDDNPVEQQVEISVSIYPPRVFLDLGADTSFTATVFGTSDQTVSWRVEDISGGNATYGTISELGDYTAPSVEPDLDSVKITAVLIADITIWGTAWVILVDPDRIYVDISGSDSTGTGSRIDPYRTITYAVSVANPTQSVIVRAGTYDIAGGESFPIHVGSELTVSGAGSDSTHVIGPGETQDSTGAVFSIEFDAITIKKLNISTSNSNGVGIWIKGRYVTVTDNYIGPNYIGIGISGPGNPPQIIQNNTITQDSIGIVIYGTYEPRIRDNEITDCGIYGLQILDSAKPNIGTHDSTDVGGNTIRDCGFNNHYLIYSDSPDTIWALGNTWPVSDSAQIDDFIWDDDESSAGPVIFWVP